MNKGLLNPPGPISCNHCFVSKGTFETVMCMVLRFRGLAMDTFALLRQTNKCWCTFCAQHSRPWQRWPPSYLPSIDCIRPPTHHHWLNTRLALNDCEALWCLSLCDVRDVKEEDKLVHFAYFLFSGKQLPEVMCLKLRKQRPLSNALNGLDLLCEEHMLRTQWKGGRAGTLSRQARL